jgi:membrane associated rhomboid family serine protease
MGIYDRDYYRQQQRPGVSAYAPRSVVVAIIVVNVIIWIADSLVDGRLSAAMAVHSYTLTQPWLWWEFLTAGFAHSPVSFEHILLNMFALFVFGRDVEDAYGPKEFLRLYLVMVVFASVVWSVLNVRTPMDVSAYGASGAIAGVVVLYALNFPRRTLLLFFVIPTPAWLVGLLMVAADMFGATGGGGPKNVAYSMHLAGAAFAFVYFQRGWNLTRLTGGRIPWPSFHRKPRLKIHTPEDAPSSNLSAEVDRILEKIYREGEASLTTKERKTLETASREYQKKKSMNDE